MPRHANSMYSLLGNSPPLSYLSCQHPSPEGITFMISHRICFGCFLHLSSHLCPTYLPDVGSRTVRAPPLRPSSPIPIALLPTESSLLITRLCHFFLSFNYHILSWTSLPKCVCKIGVCLPQFCLMLSLFQI